VLFLVAALIGGGVALLRGGRLGNLSDLQIRGSGLPVLALALQIYAIHGPSRHDARPFGVSALLMLASYVVLLVAVAINWRLPGMVWVGLGAALNFVVILANGGWMPVTAKLLVTAGFIDTPTAVIPGQRLAGSKDVVKLGDQISIRWLSDRYVIPRAGALSAVYSLGDILMMVGLFLLVQDGMMPKDDRTETHSAALGPSMNS
jgi:hypothetical protein